MTQTSLVPVEGALARPRVAPLDHVPSFGREWTFRGAPGARPGKPCLATLTTSCIDVDKPHHACRWKPLPLAASAPTPATSPAAPAVASRHSRRMPPAPRDRRAMYATCWSVGALGIIGLLIAAHEPLTGFEPAYALHATGVVPDHATSSTGSVQVVAVQPGISTIVPPEPAITAPVAITAESPPATHRVTHRPASLHPKATPDVQRTAAASPHRANGPHTAATPTPTPTVTRLAARPPARSDTPHTAARDRLASRPPATDALDDPLTLIAMANALGADQPTRATHAPAAGFDWTSRLSHRRVTDAPDTFAH
ncbi:hypothetical protein BBJ41_07030 [Burkholderia stabilis]|uniref:hypothetical protein n=1 Tax=Burkholderia stabilis TaxID=95485 RepID=UPI000851AED2|nr:hypothetical protein [Burkholderia stabilis]AOR67320.1 hypothetical protein BBJ41_07030 [Burkholderia stabilis]HDR9493562.1 hypothetical protein [Burkholderia stabilis]HDR9523879.1 hypothetical protein [Burkholderia stabilis]HDR9529668.1 hypothetical protein [Burkholderia stabilis]HDR9540881.1 hypothetical protein [Burkholderia stabilis]